MCGVHMMSSHVFFVSVSSQRDPISRGFINMEHLVRKRESERDKNKVGMRTWDMGNGKEIDGG